MTQTVQAVQAALDSQGFNTKLLIEKKFTVGTTDTWYVLGGTVYPGRARWVTSTNSDTAANQATSITNGMA